MKKIRKIMPRKKTVMRFVFALGLLSISTAALATSTGGDDPVTEIINKLVEKASGPWGIGLASLGITGIAGAMIVSGDFQTWGKRLGVTVIGSAIIVGGAKLLKALGVAGAVMYMHGMI